MPTDLDVAIRQAIAAAILAGDDARAEELRKLLPKPAPVVKLVKRAGNPTK